MLCCKQDTFCEMLFNTKQKHNFEKPGKAGILGFISGTGSVNQSVKVGIAVFCWSIIAGELKESSCD